MGHLSLGGGVYWRRRKESDAILLPEYISAGYLTQFVDDSLRERVSAPIEYIAKNKVKSAGFEATILPDVCNVWIRAEKAGALLTSEQVETAEKAYTLLRGFANVGIIALIDEATGFQEEGFYLRKILDTFLEKEYARWAKKFPDEFYEQMFRLRGWQWKGMKLNRPSIVGKYTNDLVYQRLAPGLLDELRRLNPPDEHGRRKSKHQQWLSEDVGHPALQEHLHAVIVLMRASTTWDRFYRSLQWGLPKLNEQIPLALEE
jgi:hypothetical protein